MTPSVCAICLTADRQVLTDRAVQCFLSQTYKQSHLLIYDTGKKPYVLNRLASSRIILVRPDVPSRLAIGGLRNEANELARAADILIHWDSDDWSGPYRIQDQVPSLIDSGKECVGYRSVLFWRSGPYGSLYQDASGEIRPLPSGQTWEYHNIDSAYCIGASLCYWRKVWERRKFREDLPGPERGMAEDREWLWHVYSEGYSAISGETVTVAMRGRPSLVCEIHGSNTMVYTPEDQDRGPTGWKRAPEWDARLERIMQL